MRFVLHLYVYDRNNGFVAKIKQSAGLAMYQIAGNSLRVLIVRPAGPYFAGKDEGIWGIPKGEFKNDESAFAAARREFEEETGMRPPESGYISLGSVLQKGGKRVHAWAFEGFWEDGRKPISNQFDLEWPPRSGNMVTIPEIDEALMVGMEIAREKMREEQYKLIERLAGLLGVS